jgi:hypothetical protein
MEGLGDLVAKVTEVTGIKAVVEAVAGKDCGCAQRQAKLNEIFPFNNEIKKETRHIGEIID